MADIIDFGKYKEQINKDMSREFLQKCLNTVREQIAIMDEREPMDMNSEEFEEWAELHEELEDSEDELMDFLDDMDESDD